MVFHGSLNDSKSPQVSRTFLNILLTSTMLWFVLQFLILSHPLPSLSGSFQPHQLQLVSTSPSFSIAFFIVIIILFFWEFVPRALADGFSLESEWQQVSRTLLSILSYLCNAVVWMVSTRPLIFKSSRPCINPLVTVPSVPVTTSITVIYYCEFFTPALTGGFSLKSERQKVSSGLQDFSKSSDFISAVVWMVSILYLILNYLSFLSRPLRTISSAPNN